MSEIKKWISAITSQKPGLWFADLVGQPIRGLVFGVKLPEFLSQSQIKGDYNFSILVLENIYNSLWELEAIGLWVNFIVGGSWWWWWWWKWLGFMHLILCCFSPWCCKVTNKFRDLTEKCIKYYMYYRCTCCLSVYTNDDMLTHPNAATNSSTLLPTRCSNHDTLTSWSQIFKKNSITQLIGHSVLKVIMGMNVMMKLIRRHRWAANRSRMNLRGQWTIKTQTIGCWNAIFFFFLILLFFIKTFKKMMVLSTYLFWITHPTR